MGIPPPVPYSSGRGLTPLGAERRIRWFSVRLACAMWPWGLVGLAIILGIVPRFGQIFGDFKIELPALTRAFLSISTFLASTYLWLPLLGLLIATPFLVPIFLSMMCRDDEQYGKRIRWIAWLLAIVFGVATLLLTLAVFMPMTALIQGLSSQPHK